MAKKSQIDLAIEDLKKQLADENAAFLKLELSHNATSDALCAAIEALGSRQRRKPAAARKPRAAKPAPAPEVVQTALN